MKTYRKLLPALIIAFATILFATNCNKPEPEIPDTPETPDNPDKPDNPEKPVPVLTLSEEMIEVPEKGGTFEISYKLENPIEGAVVSASTEAGWITDFNCKKEGVIEFRVKVNNGMSRKAAVEVSYPDLKDKPSFIVRQAEQVITESSFELNVKDITKRFATIDVFPKDKEMDYITFIIPKDTLNLYASNDEEIFKFDSTRFSNAAELYGITLTDMLMQLKSTGDIVNSRLQGMMPSIDYYLYAYGVDVITAERLTEVAKIEFRTNDVQMIETDFDIETGVDMYTASVKVTAKDYSGWCYMDIYAGIPEDATYDEIYEAVQDNWTHLLELYDSFGISPEDMFKEVAFQNMKEQTAALRAGTLFHVIAFALDEEGLLCSNITYEPFRTEEVRKSDNVITIKISDVGSTTGIANFITTNDDPYVQIARPKSEFEGFNSDEEIMEHLLRTWYMESIRGNYERHLEMMEPDTEYLAVAFGYAGYTYNTELFTAEFKTLPYDNSHVAPAGMCPLDVRRYAIGEPEETAPDSFIGLNFPSHYMNRQATYPFVPFIVR